MRATRRSEDGKPPWNIFATVAHHPDMYLEWWKFGGALFSDKSRLPARDREILILRTGWNCQAEYEWAQHTRVARNAGMSDEEIVRLTRDGDPDSAGWDAWDATLVRTADELHFDSHISDATWARLAERYDTQQLIEVPMVVGQYHLVSMTLNSLGVQLDPGLVGFPRPSP
jgi:alkylhydroperoxidase family enzyme